MSASKNLSGVHQQVFENRTQAERREKCKCADNQDDSGEQEREKRRGDRESASRYRNQFFATQVASKRQNRDVLDEASQQHGEGERHVEPESVAVEPAESRAVVARRRSVGVKDLCEPVRSGIRNAGSAELIHD